MKIIEEKDQSPALPEREGFVAVEKTVNALSANIWALVIGIPILTIITVVHFLLWKDVILQQITTVRFWGTLTVGILVLCFVVMFLYELFHGLAWCMLSGTPVGRMRFGLAANGLIFQCRLEGELLTKRDYVRGLIAPDIIFAIILLALGLYMNWYLSTFMAGLVLMSMIADIMLVNSVKSERDDTLLYIHPKKAGVYAYHNDEE